MGLCTQLTCLTPEREDAVLRAFSLPSAFSGEEGVCGRKERDDSYLLSPALLRSEEGELVPRPLEGRRWPRSRLHPSRQGPPLTQAREVSLGFSNQSRGHFCRNPQRRVILSFLEWGN